MHLSNQALGAIMMALQESLLHQTDIVPVLQGFKIEDTDEGLVVKNPPTVSVPKDLQSEDAPQTDDTNASL
jgi:hypothetical protein